MFEKMAHHNVGPVAMCSNGVLSRVSSSTLGSCRLACLMAVVLLLSGCSSTPSLPREEWPRYEGSASAAYDTRESLWLPENMHVELTGPGQLHVTPGGSCEVELKVGSSIHILSPGQWRRLELTASSARLRTSSACGMGVALEIADLRAMLPNRSASPRERSSLSSDRSPQSTQGSSSAWSAPLSHRHDVVLITIDTLRPDFLGTYGDAGGLSPHLDAFAQTATVFDRARAQAPWTGPSMASLMTGRESAGLDRSAELVSTLPTLAESFSRAGYRSLAAVNNPRLSAESGMNRGFQQFRGFGNDEALVSALPELLSPEGVGSSRQRQVSDRAAERVSDRAAERVSDRAAGRQNQVSNMTSSLRRLVPNKEAEPTPSRQPTFLWVHLLGPHLPYDPSPEDLEAAGWTPAMAPPFYEEDDSVLPDSPFSQSEKGRIRTLYRADIHHADRNLARVLELIEKRFPQATVILTSDHGEELWEHGAHGHGHAFWREVLAVPLLARGPGFDAGARVAELMRLCDVGPSLLRSAGIAIPESMTCQPLQERSFKRWAPAGNPLRGARLVSVESARWKLIATEAGRATGLYEIATNPNENQEVASTNSMVVENLKELARSFVESAPPPPGPARARLTLTTLTPAAATLTLRSESPLDLLPDMPPGRWGRVEVTEGGKVWTLTAPRRSPDREGILIDLALACKGPVSAEVLLDGEKLPDQQWRVAGTPAAPGVRTLAPRDSSWRSDEAATQEPRVDLWMQPLGEPPVHHVFSPETRERLRSLGYIR